MQHETSHLTSVGKLPRRSLNLAPCQYQQVVLVQPVHHTHLPADQTASVPPVAGHPTPRTPALLWVGRVVGAIRRPLCLDVPPTPTAYSQQCRAFVLELCMLAPHPLPVVFLLPHNSDTRRHLAH